MTYKQFISLVNAVRFGKRLPDAVYLHKSAIDLLPSRLLQFIKFQIINHDLADKDWDILKLSKTSFRISLLHYPHFYDDPYPELQKSYCIDMKNNKYREIDYSNSQNPPILHRKETFIKKDAPYYEAFCEITKEAEKLGLYEHTKNIGYKRQWFALIQSKGYKIQGNKLIKLI